MFNVLPAGTADIAALKSIALAAKAHWGYPQTWLDAWAQSDIVTADMLMRDAVFVAHVDDWPVAWYRLCIEGDLAMLEDLWVLPASMGRGLGRRLFQHAVEQAKQRGSARIELDADPNAQAFYEHMGCWKIGETLSEWGRMIPRMAWVGGESAELRR